MRQLRLGLWASGIFLLSGCDLVLFNPSGDVAAQQGDLIVYSTVLMLIVILPVMVLTVFFAIKYRSGNEDATYDPDWDHSVSLEIVVWSVPLAIIICLAGLTWVATHRLEPYSDLRRVSEDTPIDPSVEPLTVHVVALDWKWLFLYPEQGIALVNEAAVIVDRPVEWKITSDTVMNAFYVPEMAGMIYAMAGMETELNAVLNAPGTYEGFSANYSGNGFSQMRFDLHALDDAGFNDWVESVAADAPELDLAAFETLSQPSVDHDVTYFGAIEGGLWERILNMCTGSNDLCLNDMMMVDALGGGGLDGLLNREMYRGICSADDPGLFLAVLRPDLEDRQFELTQAINGDPTALLPSSIMQAN